MASRGRSVRRSAVGPSAASAAIPGAADAASASTAMLAMPMRVGHISVWTRPEVIGIVRIWVHHP